MGSPALAVPTLEALAREHDLLAVFTQPDKPAGRGRKLTAVPVKVWAQEQGVPTYQPRSLRKEPEAVEALRALTPDVIVVVAYGLILPQAVLDLPPYGCLNVHASRLPRYRGAAPIAAAILAGETETGVTIMRMDAGVDTGPLYAQAREPIRPDDTTLTLGARLGARGATLLVETLPRILRGELQPIEQDHSLATLSPKIDKDDGRIDWSKSAIEIDRMIRAYAPWPGTFTIWNGSQLKVVRALVNQRNPQSAPLGGGQARAQVASQRRTAGRKQPANFLTSESTGRVILIGKSGAGVITGDGILELREVQLAGKRAMPIEEFLRGHSHFIGAVLTAGD